jgi:hypothetical protein
MLRFERKSRNREVSISLRNQEGILNRLTLTAFAFALGLHLFGVLLFHVSPFTISSVTMVHPPVVVRTDPATASDSVVYATIDGANDVTPNISKPVFAMPELPQFPRNKNLSLDPGKP